MTAHPDDTLIALCGGAGRLWRLLVRTPGPNPSGPATVRRWRTRGIPFIYKRRVAKMARKGG